MARVIGFVKSLQNGVFFAKDEQGAIRELKAGDQIFQNELVYGGPNNSQNAQVVIDVAFADAKDITLSGSAQLYTDLSVIGGTFEKEEAIVSKDSVEDAWKLSAGTPIAEGQIDATAAGLEETAAGQVVSDTERAGGPIFDTRTGAIGNVSTNLRDSVNSEINPNLAGQDTQNLNDQPVVADVIGVVNEALNGFNIISGQLVASDPDVTDTHTFFAVKNSLLVNGEPAPEGIVLVLNLDGTYSVTGNFNALAVGENAVVTFQYYAVDNGLDVGAPHASLPSTVTLTINGTNDQPVISDIHITGTGEGGGIVGYYDMNSGEGVNVQVNGITTAGLTGVKLFTLSAEELNGINTLYIQNPYGDTSEYLSQMNAISQAVENGMTLIIHDRALDQVNALLPGDNVFNVHYLAGNSVNIEIIDNGLETGLGGSINDTSLDNGSYSNHGYVDLNSLPEGAKVLMTDGDSTHIVTFSYQYGAGTVIYSTIPLDYYLASSGDISANMQIYAANLLEDYATNSAIYETHDSSEVTPLVNDGNNILSGNLSVLDDDVTDTHTFRVVDESVLVLDVSHAGIDLGDVSVSIALVDGAWQYNINGNFTELAAGEKATLTFQYVADDGHGFDGTDGINESSVSAPKTITLTITGTNDQPVISDININAPLSFGSDNWFEQGNGLTIVGYENDGSIVTPILHNGGLGIGTGWGEDSEINDQIGFGGRSAEAIAFGFEQAFNTATIELTSLNQGTWFSSAEKAEWIAYKDGVEVGRGILSAQVGADIYTIHTTSDFNSLKIAPPLDWETDSFYVKSLNVSKTFYESHDATPIDTTEDVTTTFNGNLDATVIDDDTNDTHQFFGVMREASIAYELDAPAQGVSVENITINPNGTYSITGNFNALAAGESATISFQYYAVDNSSTQANGESNTSEAKTVTMTITGTNDQPVVTDFTVSVSEASLLEVGNKEDYRYVGQLEVTDHDVSDTHTFSMLSNSIKVSITTVNGDESSSTTTLTSYQVQHLIWEGKLTVFLNENTGEYTVSSTLFNTLGANQSMRVSFDYRASDGNGFDGTDGSNESSLSVAQSATLVVNGTNDQPVAYGDTQSVWEQELSNIPSEDTTFGGRLPGASDEDAISHITYVGVDADNNGKVDVTVVSSAGVVDASQTIVTVNANGTYSVVNPTFDALAAGEKAIVTFSYVVDDGSGATDESSQSAPKTVTLTINGTNDQPVVENVTIAGAEAITGVNTFTGSLHVNDVDTSDDHTFAIRSGSISSNNPLVSGLLVTLTSEGEYTIIGNFNKLALGESATITFQYRADDHSGSPSWDESRYSEYKTVTLNVTGTNDVPVFTVDGESYSFNYNENSAAGTLIGTVLATDIDHGSSVSYSISSGNDAGYFAINPTTGAITLTEAGAHAFTNNFEALSNSHALVVGASDGIVTTSINVMLNEQNINDAPDAIDDFGASGVRAGYYGYHEGVDGGNLLSVAQIRAFIAGHTPDATFAPTLLDYQQGTGDLANGTHLQTFLGADALSLDADPSDATDGIIHMVGYLNMDAGTYNFKILADDGYAILVDGQPVATFDNIQSPTTHEHASFTIAASGLHQVEVIYWDQAGEYVFKVEISKSGGAYQVLDMSGGTSSLVTSEDTALTLTAATLLANDIDQDGDTLSITSVQSATHGTVALNGDGTVTFTPTANYNGDATFTYTISDGNGGSDTATVTLHVTPVNDAPTFASPYAFNYNENSVAGTIIGTVQATDIDSASLIYSITGGNSNGYFAINSATGAISLSAIGATSLANDYETLANIHNLTVNASDGSLSASIAVTLNEQNVAESIAHADTVITNAGTANFVIPEWALLANDTSAIDITAVSNKSDLEIVNLTNNNSSITVQDDSNWPFSPDGGSFDYTVDGGSSAHVIVTQKQVGQWDLDGTNNSEILIGDNMGTNIYGYGGNDVLIGGSQADMLDGGAGNDKLYGGAGNDILVYDGADSKIDGGTGTDTLLFTSNTTINFSSLDSSNNPIKNIEVLDLTQAKVTITNLSLNDVIDMTDSNNHTLTIQGSGNDSVNIPIPSGNYVVAKTTSSGFDVYTYSHTGDPTVVVKIDQDIHHS